MAPPKAQKKKLLVYRLLALFLGSLLAANQIFNSSEVFGVSNGDPYFSWPLDLPDGHQPKEVKPTAELQNIKEQQQDAREAQEVATLPQQQPTGTTAKGRLPNFLMAGSQKAGT